MGLELLTQADLVLNACGRPVPPPGFKFVDLPRIIPFHHTPQGTLTPGAPFIYGSETGVVHFTNLTLSPITLNILEGVGPLIVISGNTITITDGDEGGATVTNFLNAWNASPAATMVSLVNIDIAFPGVTSFYQPPNTVGQILAPASWAFTEGWPTQDYVSNTSNTLFICMGIMLQTDPVSVRIKWPNGRYWNQFPSGNPYAAQSSDFPQGTGGNLFALDEPVMIERGGKVAIEMSGINPGNVDVHLWGKLRYLLKDTGGLGSIDGGTCIVGYPDSARPDGPPNCLVGYPVKAGSLLSGQAGIKMIPDPVEVLKYRPRFSCWPNGNIMAPEFRLGNQCETDTPPGYQDDSFTFFSDPIVLNTANSGQSYSNHVAAPGQDDIVIRRWRAICTWVGDGSPVGIPVVQIRLPNGYSVTGGDQIPINLGYWYPMFPTLRVAAGTRFILDVTDPLGGEAGTLTVTFEFDAVKRRRAS